MFNTSDEFKVIVCNSVMKYGSNNNVFYIKISKKRNCSMVINFVVNNIRNLLGFEAAHSYNYLPVLMRSNLQ